MSSEILAPIVLFAYDRPHHLRRTVEALLDNQEARSSKLIVFADSARTYQREIAVNEVGQYLEKVGGFRSVELHYRPRNYGLANSIIEGLTTVFERHDRAIVLEDDMVTSPYFLRYMNEALTLYDTDDRVASIHGYTLPVTTALPETFFLRGADCWGWATWRRGWQLFNHDGQKLYEELRRQKLLREFDFNNSYPYSGMLKAQIRGKNNSWAIRWYASTFLANKLTMHPGRSLVYNIGNDGSGTHCGHTNTLDTLVSATPVTLGARVQPSREARDAYEDFFSKSQPSFPRKFASKVSKFVFSCIS